MGQDSDKYRRGERVRTRRVQDKKLRGNLKSLEKQFQEAEESALGTEVLNVQAGGQLEAEGLERTYKFPQTTIREAVDGFELSLDKFGPYSIDYTRNGKFLLLGGRKGHVASFNWKDGTLNAEVQLRETVRDVKWLHNEHYFVAAQKKYVFMYDRTGTEIHCLKSHIEVNAMEFLPYHFLLATIGNAGYLKYQDTSTGQLVSEHRTRQGSSSVLCQNPYNAVLNIGHAKGTVSMWSPASSEPLVRILAHRGPVRGVACDRDGRYMCTAGADSQLKIWDIRTFKEVHSYYTPTPASTLSISDTGLLGIGWGPHTTIWKDALRLKQQDPYLTHLNPSSQTHDLQFCPFEDILGVGHDTGFSSLIIPGAGEANYDAYEVNPYENTKQRQETEVRGLLEKLRPEMICLEPNVIGTLDRASSDVRKQERIESQPVPDKFVPRPKARGKNSSLRRFLRKKARNVVDERKLKIESALEKEKSMRQAMLRKQRGEAEPEDKYGAALSRFAMRPKR